MVRSASALFLWSILSAAPGLAQAVRELPQDTSVESLVDALKPTAKPLTRGLGSALPAGPANCKYFQERTTRGLGVRPVSEPVALQVIFEFNSASLTEESKELLGKLAKALADPELSPCCFKLEGHTDAIGSEDYNLILSQRRARAVAEYLSTVYKLDSSRFLVEGKGEVAPIAPNDDEQSRHRNRRVQVVNLGSGGEG